MNSIVDIEQRQRALSPGESFIVQAPAGSGKTELLIQRYLRVLSLVSAPEEVIAITFTRKAAAEMRGRILKALDQVSGNEAGGPDTNTVTGTLAAEVLAQDRRQNWQLADNPGRLRIQTIDSLTASLTRQMPILSRFGAQPETLEDASELYLQAADNTLAELESGDQWSAAISVLLQHLDNDLPRVRNMLADMLARRDQWLRHIARQQQRQELEEALAHQIEQVLQQACNQFPPTLVDELLALSGFAAKNLLLDNSDSAIVNCADLDSLPGAGTDDLSCWRGLTALLFTQEGKWRKVANVNLGFPPANANKAESETRKAMKSRYAALLARLSMDEELTSSLVEITYLPAAKYTEAEWQVVDALYQLLILADAQLRLLFAERGQMDFSGITQAAIQAMGKMDAPTELALQLDHQIQHILVDEFQDISINQYVLLEKLTAGWSMDDGHSLFLVGDPMQSIYRFREAEVGLFLNTWQQRRLNQVALVPLNISVNFRSDSAIVDWINRVFAQVLPAVANIGRGAVNYVKADAFYAAGSDKAVQIHASLTRDDAREADLVAQLAADARQKNPHASIAILVRNRSHLREIVNSLKRDSVPYQAIEIESMGQRAAMQDLLALSLALTHLADRVAWLAVLRAPWCGLTLADLHQLAGQQKNALVWDCMQDAAQVARLSKPGQARIKRITGVIAWALAERGRRPLHRWLESVWMKIGGPASLQHESDLENSLAFFHLLQEFDEAGELKERESFSEQVASLYAAPEISGEASVQIMTIHKAKGLEFDTVILPGLAKGSGADASRLLLWMETPHASHQDLLLAPVKEAGESESLIYNYLKRLENEKQDYELGRLLYVAATRAKKQLHIVATAETSCKEDEVKLLAPRRNSLLARLWPTLKEEFENTLQRQSLDTQQPQTAVEKTHKNLRRLKDEWLLPLAPPSLTRHGKGAEESGETALPEIEYAWAGETIKHVGTVVHRCIQCLAEQGKGGWSLAGIESLEPYYQSLLQGLGVSGKDLAWASSQVYQALNAMLDDERGMWLFSSEHTLARNEYALSGVYQGKVIHVNLDRTFVDNDGVRWVVDYKTSRHEGRDLDDFLDQQRQRYQGQLQRYGVLIKELDDRPVKLGLYFPLLRGWREWSLS